jgi:hypothetical protein
MGNVYVMYAVSEATACMSVCFSVDDWVNSCNFYHVGIEI